MHITACDWCPGKYNRARIQSNSWELHPRLPGMIAVGIYVKDTVTNYGICIVNTRSALIT